MRNTAASNQQVEFRRRLSHGLSFERYVKNYLWISGFQPVEFGLDVFPQPVKDSLIELGDKTSLFLRHLPDFYCVVPGKRSFMVECKAGKPHTGNFAFDAESWKACQVLTGIGVNILVVTSGPRAQWFSELRPEREYRRPPRTDFNGSGKPFLTIAKKGLPGLAEVLKIIKSENSGGIAWSNQKG